MTEKKKTAGQIVFEHDSKKLDLEDDVREYSKEIIKDIIPKIHERAHHFSKIDPYINKNFYIVYTALRHRTLKQPKQMIWARQSCPTPVYDQMVFKFHHISQSLEYLWTIPSMLRYWDICNNQSKYITDKEWSDIAKFVILMENGELLEWVKKENGEKIDAVIRINSNKENE